MNSAEELYMMNYTQYGVCQKEEDGESDTEYNPEDYYDERDY